MNIANYWLMIIKVFTLNIVLVLASTIVTVSKSYAQAPLCIGLFQSSPRTSDSIPKVKAMNEAQVSLLDFLEPKLREMKNGGTIKQSEIQEWLNRIDAATADFFNDAGITYKKAPVIRRQVQINQVIIPELIYDTYRIESSNTLTPIARLLNGIILQQKLKGLKITYEPMLFLLRPGSPGQYDPKGKELYFSVDALVYRMIGVSDVLRHELNHALQDSKIFRGEPTLASFEFKQGKRKDHGYSDYLALDEVESYLRDLRYLKFSASRQDRFVDDALRLEAIKKMRKESTQNSVKLIKMIIASAREILNDLKTQDPLATNVVDGTAKLIFMGLDNQFYDGANVTFHLAQNQTAKVALLERIAWAERRLLVVESELKLYEQ